MRTWQQKISQLGTATAVLGLAACVADTGAPGGAEVTASTSAAMAAALQSGWTNAPFSTRNAAFYLDPASGIVHFSGAVASGAPSLLFKLPANLAPLATTYVPVDLCGGANGRLVIGTDGSVNVDTSKYSDATCFTSLEGASFASPAASGFSSVSLQNGWVPYASGTLPAVGLVGGAVRFKGAIRSGTSGTAFTLPPGLAPSTTVYVPVDLCGATEGRLIVSPDGSVYVQAETAFSNAQCFTSLDGAWFVPTETTPLADSPFAALTMENGWVTYPGQSTPAARNRGGIVQLKGAIRGGTTNAAFTLPPSMWPTADVYVPVDLCGAHKGRLRVHSNGSVEVFAAYTGNFSDAQCFTSLEGVEYPIQGYDAACPVLDATNPACSTSWAPSSALVARLRVLGQLATTTATTIANAAYFKDASSGPAMSVALALGDGPFYTQGYGNVCFFVQGLGTVCAGEPTADTAYYIASSTKVFTAAAMLRLLHLYPNVHLDDPASTYYSPIGTASPPLPFPGHTPSCALGPITLRHLITHASGLPNYGSTYPAGTNTQIPDEAQFDAMVASSSLEFYPGCNRDYSGVGISVAGRVIENISGTTYAQFISNQVLAPLDMKHSSIDRTTLPSATYIAQPYQDVSSPPGSGQNVTYQAMPPFITDPVTALAPAGHLITTAGDMSKFLAMQLSATNPNPPIYPPLTPADVTLSQIELLPNLHAPLATDPIDVSTCGNGGSFVACQQAGAAWFYGAQATELGPHYDAVLNPLADPHPGIGNFVTMAGGSAGYGSLMYVAPQAGVAAAVLSTANPDGSSNPHNGFNGVAINALAYDAANALNNASLSAAPMPAALEQLMALLNGPVTPATIAQTFSPTFISQNPSLATTLKNLQSLGTCSSFTVQRINSTYSANVTLWCVYGSKPMTFTATTAAPYRVDSVTL